MRSLKICTAHPILYGLSNQEEMGGTCSSYRGRKGAYKVLVGKHAGKRLLGIPRPRWKDNIKMDLQEVGWRSMDWIDLAQDRER
jgi:hypothetical protein